MKRLQEMVMEITKGKATSSEEFRSFTSYHYGNMLVFAEKDEKKVRFSKYTFGSSMEDMTKKFIYALEGTTLFTVKVMQMFDKMNLFNIRDLEEDGLRIIIKLEEEKEHLAMGWIDIEIPAEEMPEEIIEEDEEPVEVIYDSSDDDEEPTEVIYDSSDDDEDSTDEDETDEDETDENSANGYYEWCLEVKNAEDTATYHAGLKDLIEYAIDNERCVEEGAYVTHFSGDCWYFAEQTTHNLNKMLKSIQIDNRLPF